MTLTVQCRGLLARQGASLEMPAQSKHQSACGLSGPRGFKSPSRRSKTSCHQFVVVAMQSQSLKATLFVESLQVFHRGKTYAKIPIAAQDGFRERRRILERVLKNAHRTNERREDRIVVQPLRLLGLRHILQS